jgi:hypothetical protein
MKAYNFETRNIEHPEGKRSKSTGNVLKVTQYSTDGFKTVYESSDIITLGSGKDVKRYLKAELSEAELKDIMTKKGETTLRKICSEAAALAKRIENAAKNSGVILSGDQVIATNDFTRHMVATALDKLMGAEDKEGVMLPF